MRVIIAGMRTGAPWADIYRAVSESGFEITEVVSGAARGVDRMGEKLAADRGIPVTRFPADWKLHGKSAGPIRNAEMADYADALIAVWDGHSRGTGDMIDTAKKLGLPHHVQLVAHL